MLTKRLKVTQDEQMDDEENVESHHETKYFEMFDFPPMAHKSIRQKKIVERECYVTIFEYLMKDIKKYLNDKDANLVVTWNPGIGKSRFYLYFIFRFIRDQKLAAKLPRFQLIINFDIEYYKYYFVEKQFCLLSSEEVHALQQHKNVLRLIDAKSSRLTGWSGVSILFSSPGLSGMNDYIKVVGTKYILPVWGFDELLEYNSLLDDSLKLSDGVLNARYDKYGGIPRFIFEEDESLNNDELKDAIGSFSRLSMISFISPKKNVRKDQYAHRVLQMVPNRSDFQNYFHLDFLSQAIAEQVIEKANEDNLRRISKFALIHWDNGLGITGVLWDKIYKVMCHRQFKLSKGLKLNFRSLCMGMTDFELLIPADLKTVRFSKLEDIKVDEIPKNSMIYYQPTPRTFDALNAFIVDSIHSKCYGLHITTNKEYEIKAVSMITFLEWLKNRFEFYYGFVVPSNIERQFEKQKIKTEKDTFTRIKSKWIHYDFSKT